MLAPGLLSRMMTRGEWEDVARGDRILPALVQAGSWKILVR